tara:strand:- start:2939 stop:3592 length:654 start_codon:yes stop_codon:yes gene_type:complete
MINERSIGIVDNLQAYCFHILGCGAIGSSAAMQLARMGAEEMVLYDFDKVEIENVGVSQYFKSDIDNYKVDALKDHIHAVNEDIRVVTHARRFDEWESTPKADVIILGFDSMQSRLEAVTIISNAGKYHRPMLLIDGRMGAEHYQQYLFLKPTLKSYIKSWYSDEEGDPEPCNAKATSYCSNMSGSFISNAIRRFVMEQPLDLELSFNFPTSMIQVK